MTMAKPRLSTLTIGQAPRADIMPILAEHLSPRVEMVHAGLLDGLSRDQIHTRFAPQGDEAVLTTRLLDGSPVVLGKGSVRRALINKLAELDTPALRAILLLCTGEFAGLACRNTWLIEPDRLVPPVLATLAGGRQVGIIVPLAAQIESEFKKWAVLDRPPICAAASPYAQDIALVGKAAATLREQGAQMLVMDCMGFAETHREVAREASGLPVVLSNALMARLVAEMC
jgi:protein AroM